MGYFVVNSPDPYAPKRMRLRYAGTCRTCGSDIASREWAIYHRSARQVECIECADGAITEQAALPSLIDVQTEPVIDVGVAGASARREHERRVAKRDARVRAAHPVMGGFLLAVTDQPQSTAAWARGALGEEKLGQRLDMLADQGVRVLHDRRIPRTRANIDHIAVSSAGVFVIDAKRYKGRPDLRVQGGLFRPRTESLIVGGRDCTKLVDGMNRQLDVVRAALSKLDIDDVPLTGMLCFVEADWPLIGGSFRIDGIQVLWPRLAADRLCADGDLGPETVTSIHRCLAAAFPVA